MTKDFFALSLLDPLLVSDESAKLYQALIKENQIASDVSGGFNYGLGNNFDYNGPMLYTFRVDYRPDLKGADVLKVVDKVISARPGARHHRRRAQAGQGQFPLLVSREPRKPGRLRPRRSARGAGALRRRPEPDQHDPDRLDAVTAAHVQAGGEEISGACEPHDHRSQTGGGAQVKSANCTIADWQIGRLACSAWRARRPLHVRSGRRSGRSGRFSWRRASSARCRTDCASSSPGRPRFRRCRSR